MDAPQRPLNDPRVRGFAAQMAAGQWRVTHQPIGITPDGICVDGQHRLHAVVLAGQGVPMSVAYDVDAETFDVIDVGAKRSPGNILSIAGFTDGRTVAAAARLYLTYLETVGTATRWANRKGPGPHAITESHILAFVRTDMGQRMIGQTRAAAAVASSVGRSGIRSSMMTTLAIIAEENGATSTFDEFVERLESGARLDERSPILAYRRFLALSTVSQTYSHSHARQQVIVLAGLKAWNDYANGATREVMTVKLGIEKMPRVVSVVQKSA
jgi:hypothetical protein